MSYLDKQLDEALEALPDDDTFGRVCPMCDGHIKQYVAVCEKCRENLIRMILRWRDEGGIVPDYVESDARTRSEEFAYQLIDDRFGDRTVEELRKIATYAYHLSAKKFSRLMTKYTNEKEHGTPFVPQLDEALDDEALPDDDEFGNLCVGYGMKYFAFSEWPLNEGAQQNGLFVYHRTKSNPKNIYKNGFDLSGRNMGRVYGDGIYTNYDLNDQMRDAAISMYGPHLIKLFVNLSDFLVLDQTISKTSVVEQLKKANMLHNVGKDERQSPQIPELEKELAEAERDLWHRISGVADRAYAKGQNRDFFGLEQNDPIIPELIEEMKKRIRQLTPGQLNQFVRGNNQHNTFYAILKRHFGGDDDLGGRWTHAMYQVAHQFMMNIDTQLNWAAERDDKPSMQQQAGTQTANAITDKVLRMAQQIDQDPHSSSDLAFSLFNALKNRNLSARAHPSNQQNDGEGSQEGIGNFAGVLFDGSQDGKVCVIYNLQTVKMVGFALNVGVDPTQIRWQKVTPKNMAAK
jgi:hypothetical protein